MAYMCLACSEVYDGHFDVCPKVRCNGGIDDDDDIIYVDDEFAPVLAEFNKKGFQIEDASFGNANNTMLGQPYVLFSDYLFDIFGKDGTEKLFVNLPSPWQYRVEGGCPSIYCYIFGESGTERYKKFIDAHMQLAYFVEDLNELDF